MSKLAYFTDSRWRAAAILEIENLQYHRNLSSDRDEILQENEVANADRTESENSHTSKIADGGRPPY